MKCGDGWWAELQEGTQDRGDLRKRLGFFFCFFFPSSFCPPHRTRSPLSPMLNTCLPCKFLDRLFPFFQVLKVSVGEGRKFCEVSSVPFWTNWSWCEGVCSFALYRIFPTSSYTDRQDISFGLGQGKQTQYWARCGEESIGMVPLMLIVIVPTESIYLDEGKELKYV